MQVVVEDLSKRFGTVVAIDRVRLTISSGEFFFLLGPSGCGKTTLLRILAGLEQQDSGRVLFDGKDVTATPPERRGCTMVFQSYALWPHLSVHDNVAFGLDVQGTATEERRRRVAQALALVRLQGMEKRRPAQLSGGQQQRVALARALVTRPRLLLLDEPLSNLDARLRLEMRAELREIVAQVGCTAIYVTHDQKEALAMADRCAILRDGRIEQIGTPRELYERPNNRFVAVFLGETNLFPALVADRAEGGRCTVSLFGGARIWSAPGLFALRQPVLCSVRPETWHIGGTPPANANVLKGTLKHSTYLGEVTQHVIVPDEDPQRSVRALELHAPPRQPGPILLWVAPDDTVLLEDGPDGGSV